MSSVAGGAAPAQTRAGPLGIGGWVLFDWAAQPFYTLITTFLFAPYFVDGFMTDPVAGQSLWGFVTAAAGVAVALLSPVLGAMADASGRLKPWIFGWSVVFIVSQAALWFAVPGEMGALPLIIAAIVAAILAAEFSTVLTNAMMPSLVGPRAQGRLSGFGWAAGYAGGLLALVIFAAFLLVRDGGDETMLGLAPVLPLDPQAGEGARFTGPFAAAWYLVFVLPLFLFTPDLRGSRRSLSAAARGGWREFAQTVRNVWQYKHVVRFLFARLLYTDGLTAIFSFGGIYAVSVFGWGSATLGLFGIVLAATAGIGAALGGVLDDRVGAKPVILAALLLLITGAVGALSIDRDSVLFVVPIPNGPELGGLASFAEQAYLGFAILIGLAAGPLQSASRSFMARIAPPDKSGEFFGLFAFSGKITAFAAPLLVAGVTALSDSQRIGIASIGVFLVAGFIAMLWVKPAPLSGGSGASR
ncbi:MFS transporter [Dichotomicrobium thermohalophilum]|uniref:UMF1 family MFS transporter n=1 Tax=Dichotomicrobium thermohalophilum TaxID=933063 RepID=A0A397Q195_9HYPH|nr:MFS transporter [Dichotomicrobium thermohalophilum]RIA55280.1 UMF1 family MFS transporter [Dichotomicrobium thermohalophilum]